MTTKKKKQAPNQQVHKSSAGSTVQLKSPGRIKLKSKHKEDSGAKITSSSLIPFTKYGIGYASLVLIIGMYFIFCFARSFRCKLFFTPVFPMSDIGNEDLALLVTYMCINF